MFFITVKPFDDKNALADAIYDMLSRKYYWRDWLVIVSKFTGIFGEKQFFIPQCATHKYTYTNYNWNGKTIIVSSVDSRSPVRDYGLFDKKWKSKLSEKQGADKIGKDMFIKFKWQEARLSCKDRNLVGFMFYGKNADEIEWRVHPDRSRPHSFFDSGAKIIKEKKIALTSITRPFRHRFASGKTNTVTSSTETGKVKNYLAFIFG